MRIKEMKVEDRWSKGLGHEQGVDSLIRMIADMDFYHFGDSFGFKCGGDGDNGETLGYIIDELITRGLVEIKINQDVKNETE